jgi:hypothetical protein
VSCRCSANELSRSLVPICGGGGGWKKWLSGGAGGGSCWWIWLCG